MSFPFLPIQQAVFGVLNADATLQNLINGVYDQPPDDVQYPFIAFDDISATDWSFQGTDGADIRLSLVIFSRYSGKSEIFAILSRVYGLLHETSLSASGLTVVQTRLRQSNVEGLRDGKSMRGQMVFRILVHN